MTLSEIYKKAEVRRLPAEPVSIASALGIKVISYKEAMHILDMDIGALYSQCPLGFSFKLNGVCGIALNENACGEYRRRFTAAHELAHCVLGHLDSELFSTQRERASERFAAELLAPLVVLHKCGIRSSEEIGRVCGISRQAAKIRLKQLAQREQRGFFPDKDEQRTAEIFGEFITSYGH